MLVQWLLATALVSSGPQADIRPLLRAQGFQWTLERLDTDIEYIGEIKQGRRTYGVYLCNAVNRANLHGINFFVIILDRRRYLGVYDSLSAHDCHIETEAVACKTDYPGRRFEITHRGPPREIWIDGANSPFEPAPKRPRSRPPGDRRLGHCGRTLVGGLTGAARRLYYVDNTGGAA